MGATSAEVRIGVDDDVIVGDLSLPPVARGVVAFAHGSGSSRHSSRNRQVAHALVEAGFATLLVDLLTGPEEAIDLRTRELRFDIDLLARRVEAAVAWLGRDPRTADLRIGLFGASTGAAAALVAAADRPHVVASVVSRGGRPDLAGDALAKVTAPTLLIVGGADEPVIRLNEDAAARMPPRWRSRSCRERRICSRNPAPWSTSRTSRSAISIGAFDEATTLRGDNGRRGT